MHLKIFSIHDTESVNVSNNTLGSYEVYVMLRFEIIYCNMLTRYRKGFLIRCAILVGNTWSTLYGFTKVNVNLFEKKIISRNACISEHSIRGLMRTFFMVMNLKGKVTETFGSSSHISIKILV